MENDYLKIFLKYNSLPEIKQHISIFDVSGYPHYENVCSNVLAFYLHPQKEHDLENLVFSALLNLAKQDIDKKIRVTKIDREHSTKSGGRLDLVIHSDSHVIGIENKIFHHLNNDLADYRETINNLATNKQIPIGIVLSLKKLQAHDIKILEESDFINIIYDDLWHEVRANFGFHATSGNHKWVMYLLDFMKTTELLAGKNMNLTDRDNFFINNEEIFEKIFKDHQSFITRLNSQISKLKEIMDESEDAPKNFKKRQIYASSCLFHEYMLSGNLVVFDLNISPKGWTLQLFGRGKSSNQYAHHLALLRRNQITLDPIETDRLLIAKWPLSTNLGEIKEELCEWMSFIIQQDSDKSHNSNTSTIPSEEFSQESSTTILNSVLIIN